MDHNQSKWEESTISQSTTAAPSERSVSPASIASRSVSSERTLEDLVDATSLPINSRAVGGLHVHARNFPGPRSLLGPLACKEMPMPGAKSQALSASLGGSLHIDVRNFAG